MSLPNQAHVEAICSAAYLENYLDCLESLPDELQRILTQIREIDVKLTELEKESLSIEEVFERIPDDTGSIDQKLISQIQRTLIRMQECEDEKIQLSASLMEYIENRVGQLEQDRENLDPSNHIATEPTRSGNGNPMKKETKPAAQPVKEEPKEPVKQPETKLTTNGSKKRKSRSMAEASRAKTPEPKEEAPPPKKAAVAPSDDRGKRKRRSRVGAQTKSPKDDKSIKEPSLEPEEPTYCLCGQISYGEMIGCDNDACPIEWFHFNCVNLLNKPKGRWFCPKCRGDKPTVMKKENKK